MSIIPDIADKVPMMFRAQANGRCQIQRLDPERTRAKEPQDAEIWADEWVDKTYPIAPSFWNGENDSKRQAKVYQISWRFVTNSGQDDGVIRPVIGARGYPFYPGSSMKGIFSEVCTDAERDRYCGRLTADGDCEPAILRFHGGYPTTNEWTDDLVDLIHPQQERQVMREKVTSAKLQIALYRPELQFGISSAIAISEAEWETIWQLWERALSKGIGCRVSAGYGHPDNLTGEQLYAPHYLKGQGMASKLLDGSGEFRPNMIRAAIRGHALRIFGGLTDGQTAEAEVERLFGGVSNGGTVGLLSMNFVSDRLSIDTFGQGSYKVDDYEVDGSLRWLLTQPSLPTEQREALAKLLQRLTQFALTFGGFGKSWRRADHRLFFEQYNEDSKKPLIGCHWQWTKSSLGRDIRVRTLKQVAGFIEEVREAARVWLGLQRASLAPHSLPAWREAWHPDNVQVWGRVASDDGDSEAIRWLHQPYRQRDRNTVEGSIYQSSITGKIGQIGKLWHRMYPLVSAIKDPETGKVKMKVTPKYIELLTIFPDNSPECRDFLRFLESEQEQFSKLW